VHYRNVSHGAGGGGGGGGGGSCLGLCICEFSKISTFRSSFLYNVPPPPFSFPANLFFAIALDAGRSSYSHPEQNIAEAEKQDDKAETSRASDRKAQHEKSPRSAEAEKIKDVFKTDESIVAAGPYHTVRAGRQALMAGEMKLMGNVKRDAAREAGFCLAGDSRIKQAHLRHRLDVMLNMSLSFDPATMMCTGCKVGRLQC
jgi:hypothetical protein